MQRANEHTSTSAIMSTVTSVLSIISDLVAIGLYTRQKLQPVTYLVHQCIKTVFWTLVLILDIVAAVGGEETGLAFLFSTVEFGSSLGQLMYGSIILHQNV